MKIKSTLTNALYEFVPNGKTDQERYTCPECSHLRKKKSDKCFAWNSKEDIGYCHNCGSSFYVFKPSEKQYTVPEWRNIPNQTIRHKEEERIHMKIIHNGKDRRSHTTESSTTQRKSITG